MLWISETFIDRSRDARFGDTEPYETFTDDVGRLYKFLVKEYGRCTGKVRIDPDGRAIGWVFIRRQAYEDARHKTYLREVWVTVHEAPDTVTRTRHYKFL